ncbi:Outer membrane usher protein papC precursor [Serratia quinivorans]|uniref:Fimbrial biogenesis outer membrane usher protein n=1 Tax=Serratia proteamaculans (strain 568) TaxID=399741 RepID=A8GL26_SERP5|nr:MULTISPECIES: outer membrane usher protein [Serratia]MCS4268393.1 outer membrane usher protein FimD/PapC [Serratia sp. BIGb0163]CAI1108916.1 Outer membrane usher protein papC precursor [Serratia quinivorans]CAI1173885.1 Outer membrane usher protein papC precursor [Serratia quinivorans]CAI1787824.1 Outer membrane usher protein papC precursor [Serratia proteamaculans]CAI1870878.1 Outer membrane usher protein papC precursor [Serratia quinivorans]
MVFIPARTRFRIRLLRVCICLAMGFSAQLTYADDGIQFNTDVLDVNDRKNIDLSQFSRSGYMMPGRYSLTVHINKNELPEQNISFYPPDDDPKGSQACLSPTLVDQLGLKGEAQKALTWWHQDECLDISSLKGMEARGDLATAALYLSIPQAYLEYASADWDPPSRWDEGIPGLLFDYNLNGQTQYQQRDGSQSHSLSGNGVAGANLGAWRLRADWQGQLNRQTGRGQGTDQQLDWSRYYAYRALPALRSRLTLGEDYLNSGMFDSFRFSGASLVSDDNMLPPNLRGYAPEVAGVAKTNAKVTISQQGRVIYETQVAAGPFRIQDINDAVSGELEVRVEEQDGSVQAFKMNTASIPYLTRPGSVRYKFAAGRPSDWQHHTDGPLFGTGEFSWGVSNGWSLYGGVLSGGDYNAASLGIGRDLMALGALSFDATQSRARLPQQDGTLSGGSYRLSYSKSFDELDSQVTFAGYRFSEQDFMSMSEYLDARHEGRRMGNNKEMYTITFSKQFRDAGVSLYLNYDHQTYWDRPVNDRYNLMMSRYFDIGRFKNLSLSLSGYRNKYNGSNDDGMYLSLTMPWGSGANISYNTAVNRNDTTHRVGYYDRVDEHNNYQLSVGSSRGGANLSGYYNHEGDLAQMSANASYQEGSYSALGFSAQGGATLTTQGGALHRIGMPGATRLLLDTGGVAGVPVRGYGSTSDTNRFGKAVVTDVSNYYRNQASIDLNKLGDNAEATKSVVQATLTEGAIGYRKFDVIAGEKAMAVITLADGSTPPFGATVLNASKQETGIVNDGGSVYLSGIRAGDRMTVHWSGAAQCAINLPKVLPESTLSNLLLPCQTLPADESDAT